MKLNSRIARISAAAIATVLCIRGDLHARNLTWDADGPSGALGADGSGSWDLTSSNWVDGDLVTGTNVVWTNAPGDSAIFGNTTSTFIGTVSPNNIDFASNITVQDITIGIGTNGQTYNFSNFNGGSLTLNGNLTKVANDGAPQFLFTSPITLSSGNHVIALNDTPGDLPEMTFNSELTGSGGVTLDNAPYQTWGTLLLNVGNSYTGATNINNGRVVITTPGALGSTSAGTTIGDLGTLSIGGAGTTVTSMDIAEPITIKRSIYSGGEYDRYRAAVIFANSGSPNNHSISGPLVVDSTDARIQVNTNTLTISSNITQGPDVTAGTLTLDGDFAGFVNLTGDNTAFSAAGGAIKLINGVQLNVSDETQIGGPSSKLLLSGGTIHPTGALASSAFMTNFGSHDISGATLSTGINVDAGTTFTVNGLSGIAIGERGTGTLQFDGTNTFTGTPFYDGGTIKILATSTTTQHGLRLRSPTVEVEGTFNVGGSYTSIGVDSAGTNGNPDKAIINIRGNGKLIENSGDDFNISDNPNTEGTINLYDTGELTTGGITWLGKSNGAKGTINQSGGTININRTGNFGFVIADGRGARNPTGYYNFSGGTFNAASEVYVGEGGSNAVGGNRARGYWTQTGGTANVKDWFVVGRESAVGFVDISGGTFNHINSGNMSLGDSSAGGEVNTITLHGNAVVNNNVGGFFVGNNGGAVAVMDVYDTASITNAVGNFVVGRDSGTGTATFKGNSSLTVTSGEMWAGQNGGNGTINIQENASVTVQNNWLALGRASGASVGVLNLSGGTLAKAGGGYIAVGSGGSGTFNQTGGTLISSGTRVGEASSGTMNLSGGTSTFNGEFSVGFNDNTVGTLNINAGANVTMADAVFGVNSSNATSGGIMNLNGGIVVAKSIRGGANATAERIINFNGGTLKPSASDTSNWIGAKITGVVSTGGALLDSAISDVAINAPMTHDSALAGADGGVTKTGAGSVTFAGTNSYTGPTNVQQGTLALAKSFMPTGTVTLSPNTTLALPSTGTQQTVLTVTPSNLSIGSGAKVDVVDNKMVVRGGTFAAVKSLVDAGRNTGNWDGSGIITSQTLAKAASQVTTVAVADNALAGKTSFGGQSVNSSDILLMYTYNGDANLDGRVNADDYFVIDSSYNKGPTTAGFIKGDFNADGVINGDDFALIDIGFSGQGARIGQGSPVGAASSLSGVTAVPEPATIGLIGMAAAAMFRRRHRRLA